MTRILDWFHKLSGRKVVTYFGLGVSSISATCVLLGDNWMLNHIGDWSLRACGPFIFLGGVIAAFGKGLGDRRVDPERQEQAPVERREPSEEQSDGQN